MFDYNIPANTAVGAGSRFPSMGEHITGPEKSVYKEISKNILLHKIQLPLSGAPDGAEQKYVFKVSFFVVIVFKFLSRFNRALSRKSISLLTLVALRISKSSLHLVHRWTRVIRLSKKR